MPVAQKAVITADRDQARLVVRIAGTRHLKVYRQLGVASVAVLLILIAFVVVSHFRTGFWIYVCLGLVLLLAIAARALDLHRVATPVVLVVEKDGEVMRNGDRVAYSDEIDHVVIRDVVQESTPLQHTVLLLRKKDSRNVLVGEIIGLPDGRHQVESAAKEIAEFLGVELRESSREDTEWWQDM